MATLKELRSERLRKLEELKKLGINPYPSKAVRTHKLKEISDSFEALEGQEVSVVGRIINIRKFGKIAFVVVRDQSGQLQLFLSQEKMSALDAAICRLGFDQLPLLDSGDFIQADGKVIKTQTNAASSRRLYQ
jgi:lysyl-tRNA synthetase class 2